MPAAASVRARAPAWPASHTRLAPAARSASATGPACSAYTLSAEHRQATVAPEALNAAAIDAGSVPGPDVGVSNPPAWNRLAAKVARAVEAAALPRVARKTTGRPPVAAKCASERARSSSKVRS
jgi:hypothetical protein